MARAERGGCTCGVRVAASPTARVGWPRIPSAGQRARREGEGGALAIGRRWTGATASGPTSTVLKPSGAASMPGFRYVRCNRFYVHSIVSIASLNVDVENVNRIQPPLTFANSSRRRDCSAASASRARSLDDPRGHRPVKPSDSADLAAWTKRRNRPGAIGTDEFGLQSSFLIV